MRRQDRDVMIPTVHTGGSDKERLFEEVMAAYEAVRLAQEAMRHVTPNGRDYHVQGPDATIKALDQHQERQRKLAEVFEDLAAIALGIRDQIDEQNAARELRMKRGY